MKSKMKIWKIKEGKYTAFKQWCNDMQTDLCDDVKLTLHEEGNMEGTPNLRHLF